MSAAFDPGVALPPPTPELEALAAAAPRARIQRIAHGDRTYWLKRADRRLLRDWAARWPHAGARWLPRVEPGIRRLLREGRRLVALRGMGIAVPDVVAAGPDWLLLEDCGQSARSLLPDLAGDTRQRLLEGIVGDLAALHGAGVWHGGAQVKNTTIRDGTRFRIDFEEGFDPSVTLMELQARDLYPLLASCADHCPANGLHALLDCYSGAAGSRAVVDEAAATARAWRRRWQDRIPGGDARRGRAAADVLLERA